MAEAIILPLILTVQRLVQDLMSIKKTKEHNPTIAREIDQFITSLNENVDLLRQQLPKQRGSWALESLEKDLNHAARILEEGLENKSFEKFWDAKQIKDKLERLRQDLINKFQVKLFITTLEMVVDADSKMENFQSKMLDLSEKQSHAATAEIRKILQPLVSGMKRQDHKIQSFVTMVRSNEEKVETSSETLKFQADVLANLEMLTDEDNSQRSRQEEDDDREDYLDPNTLDLICDPVKCNDGRTYDRFSVFEYNLHQKQPLTILCDDLDARKRVFRKFPQEGVEEKFHSRRKSYRDETLQLAQKGHSAEALGKLDNVLLWDPNDKECLKMRDQLTRDMKANQVSEPTAPPFQYMDPSIQYTNPSQTSAHEQNFKNQQYQEHIRAPPTNRQYQQPPYYPPHQPVDQREQQKEVESLVIGVVVLILCFPCSLCCLPCLFPNSFG